MASDRFVLHSNPLPLCLTPETPTLQRTSVRTPAARRRSAAFSMAPGAVTADRTSTSLVSGSAGLDSGNDAGLSRQGSKEGVAEGQDKVWTRVSGDGTEVREKVLKAICKDGRAGMEQTARSVFGSQPQEAALA